MFNLPFIYSERKTGEEKKTLKFIALSNIQSDIENLDFIDLEKCHNFWFKLNCKVKKKKTKMKNLKKNCKWILVVRFKLFGRQKT